MKDMLTGEEWSRRQASRKVLSPRSREAGIKAADQADLSENYLIDRAIDVMKPSSRKGGETP